MEIRRNSSLPLLVFALAIAVCVTCLFPTIARAEQPTLELFAGADRYGTACKIAQAECGLPGASYDGVIVCSCNEGKFPDALSAAGLSGVLGYPVVAVNGVELTSSDQESLAAMKNSSAAGSLDILIVGGMATVSPRVESALGAYGKTSRPFAGADRYETNRLVYEYGASHGGWSFSEVFLARGDAFPDALTIAPYLMWAKCPIVLADPAAPSLSAAQCSAFMGASQVVALGGTVSVPARLLKDAEQASKGKRSSRLGGADRYETSALIVEWELVHGMGLAGAGFATGRAFPDALASSFLLGQGGSVLALMNPAGSNAKMTGVIRSAVASDGSPSSLRVFGGSTAVPSSVRSQIAEAAGWSTYETAGELPPINTADLDAETIIAPDDLVSLDIAAQFSVSPISDSVFARMEGVTFPSNCPVSRGDLRYIRVLHVDADGNTKTGEIVAHKAIADDVCAVFRQLYEARYPIERMRLPDDYGGDDESSMRANNTSCFNCRPIEGSGEQSWHSYGLALDINPLYNPYYYAAQGIVLPTTARTFIDRSVQTPYTLNRGDLCYRLFSDRGFEWGGDWDYPKDYQHFEKPL